jgi:hypothetical protein
MLHNKKIGGKRRNKSKKGGDASNYIIKNYGNADEQYSNVFNQVQGVSNSGFPGSSNVIRTLGGQVAGSRRKKCGGTRRKRGGFWGQLINQAIVPFSLLGLQQTYGRKKRGGKTKRRHH